MLNTTDSYYRLILTGAENAAFNGVATSSDRQFNQTLVVARGADTTIRYRCGMRIRGNSSRTYQFRPLRIVIPNGYASHFIWRDATHILSQAKNWLEEQVKGLPRATPGTGGE